MWVCVQRLNKSVRLSSGTNGFYTLKKWTATWQKWRGQIYFVHKSKVDIWVLTWRRGKKTETETFLLLLTSGMYGAFLAFSLLRDSIRSLSLPQGRNQMTRVGTRTNAAGIKNNGEAFKVSQTWVKQATNSKGKSQLLALPAHMIYMNDLFFSWREEVVMK